MNFISELEKRVQRRKGLLPKNEPPIALFYKIMVDFHIEAAEVVVAAHTYNKKGLRKHLLSLAEQVALLWDLVEDVAD